MRLVSAGVCNIAIDAVAVMTVIGVVIVTVINGRSFKLHAVSRCHVGVVIVTDSYSGY